MITSKNLVNHELIGLKIKIKDSKNKSLIGKKGTIIDETKSTFLIEEKNDRKMPSSYPRRLEDVWISEAEIPK